MEFTRAEKKDRLKAGALAEAENTCGTSYWSRSADKTLEADRKWAI